jgi:hypothetical protein
MAVTDQGLQLDKQQAKCCSEWQEHIRVCNWTSNKQNVVLKGSNTSGPAIGQATSKMLF